ncbi:MAG: preprotein translocase subunit SecG [Patescibacteria group bacterium]
MDLSRILTIIQITLSVLLIIVILLQNRGTGLSGVFGGSGAVYRTKRGIEKTLFTLTIIFSILFICVSFLQIVL